VTLYRNAFEIDEEGTEAAAATAMCEIDGCPDDPIKFHVTSSYLCFIYQPKSKIVLFSGIVRNPTCMDSPLGKNRDVKTSPDVNDVNKKFCTFL